MGRTEDMERFTDEVTRRAALGRWPQSERVAAIETLVLALSDDWVRHPDAEDAVCSALEAVGVMRRVGNMVFELLPKSEVPVCDREILHRCGGWLPSRYRGGRH